MASLNKVFLLGNLTREPELRHTAQGSPVCNFSLAVNRRYKVGEEWKNEAAFFNIIVWNKLGENCSKYLSKGKPVLVEGRLQNRSYETQEGQKRIVTEIVAENIQFLNARSDGQDSQDNQPDHGDQSDDSVPY